MNQSRHVGSLSVVYSSSPHLASRPSPSNLSLTIPQSTTTRPLHENIISHHYLDPGQHLLAMKLFDKILSKKERSSAEDATSSQSQDGSSGDDAHQRPHRVGSLISAIANRLPLGDADSRSLSNPSLASQRDDGAQSRSATLASSAPSTTAGSINLSNTPLASTTPGTALDSTALDNTTLGNTTLGKNTLGNTISSNTSLSSATLSNRSIPLTTNTASQTHEVAPRNVSASRVHTAAQTEDTTKRNATSNVTAVDAGTQTDETTVRQSPVSRVDASTEIDIEPPIETKQPDASQLGDAQASTLSANAPAPPLLRIDSLLDNTVDVAFYADASQETRQNYTNRNGAARPWPAPALAESGEDDSSICYSPRDDATDPPEYEFSSIHAMNDPEYNIPRDELDLAIAHFVVVPAVAFQPESMAKYVFPCLAESEDSNQPEKWTTEDAEDLTLWVAQGIHLMLEGRFTNAHVVVDGDLAEGGRPIGASVFCWEYGSESDGAVSSSDLALDDYNAGHFTKEDFGMPTAMEPRHYLQMSKWANDLRESVCRKLGDVFIGRESTPLHREEAGCSHKCWFRTTPFICESRLVAPRGGQASPDAFLPGVGHAKRLRLCLLPADTRYPAVSPSRVQNCWQGWRPLQHLLSAPVPAAGGQDPN